MPDIAELFGFSDQHKAAFEENAARFGRVDAILAEIGVKATKFRLLVSVAEEGGSTRWNAIKAALIAFGTWGAPTGNGEKWPNDLIMELHLALGDESQPVLRAAA